MSSGAQICFVTWQGHCQTFGVDEARSVIAESLNYQGGLYACPHKIILKSINSEMLFSSFFVRYFFRTINLIQLGITFSTKYIFLKCNFGLKSRRGSALSFLMLAMVLHGDQLFIS